MHNFKSESSRLKMYDDVNRAKIKVLIGSTFKLGIGANVQSKLKAIHHLDVPWRPADMTQREGRILRRMVLGMRALPLWRTLVSFIVAPFRVLDKGRALA